MTSCSPWRRTLASVLLALAILCLLAAFLLASCAVTWRGRSIALAVPLVLGGTSGLIGPRAVRGARRSRRWPWGLACALGVLVLAAIAWVSPCGRGGDGVLRVEHFFTRGGSFPRYTPANLVPEVDQVAAGIAIARWLDPVMDREQARRVRRLVVPLYERLAADPAFAALGSALPWAYRELLGLPFEAGHYVALWRSGPPQPALPVLLFLHGSGGNFASYWYALSPLVRERGITVIAPTFGLGNWQREGGTQAVLEALDDASRRLALAGRTVHLLAVSNGGRAAARAVCHAPSRFRSLVLVSPVVEEPILVAGTGRGVWRDRPVLLLWGSADRRVPPAYLEERAGHLRRGGARVETLPFEGEDHFLLFSRLGEILELLARWIERHP